MQVYHRISSYIGESSVMGGGGQNSTQNNLYIWHK